MRHTCRNPNEPVKIISLFSHQKALLQKATGGDREAQRALYEQLAPKMLAVCRRYIRDSHYAEDVMIDGFVKVFQHLGSFRHEGSFEGWVRRIMVREAIDFLRQRQFVVFEEHLPEPHLRTPEPSDFLLLGQIESWIEALPEGYRMVFYLHAVEGYKHPEIAELLGISENTSKTQLHKARKALQELAQQQNYRRYDTQKA